MQSLFSGAIPDPHELVRQDRNRALLREALSSRGNPIPEELDRNIMYDEGLPTHGHEWTDMVRAEAIARGQRPPTHRDFRGNPADWPTAQRSPSGKLRPFSRNGGSPMYEDF
jgi:hypothetical protein